jgi:exopolyphosphatase/guanosine-5'-triphosphate,3'-diphosphate pyrophosphatase
MRVAAVDIGTNSVLLLVAESTGGDPVILVDRAVVTRLGERVDSSRRLAPTAIERTLTCLRDYALILRELGVERVQVVGTSVLRDVIDAGEFLAQLKSILGTEIRVLSGDEEAELAYCGSLSGLGLQGEIVVCDIGGGSTEIIHGVVGSAGSRLRSHRSLQLGCVRVHERYVSHDPPTQAEIAGMRREARGILRSSPLPSGDMFWVGVAGTVTTLAAMILGVRPYDGERVHGARLAALQIQSMADQVARLSIADRSDLFGLDPARADVVAAGACILSELVELGQVNQLVVSDRGVRWGLLGRPGGLPPAHP